MPDRRPSNPRLLIALVIMVMLAFSILAIFVATR